MTRGWFAVLNPESGAGRALRDRTRILDALRGAGVAFELAQSEHAGHAAMLAQRAAREGFRKFLAIGGDGTLHQLLNGAMRGAGNEAEALTLGLVPVGRGNDWARTHRIARGYRDAAALLAQERVVSHDVGVAESLAGAAPELRYFLNIAGVGFDAHVVERTCGNQWGALSYLAALPGSFASYQPRELTLSIDHQSYTGTVFVAFAALGRYCGAGMLVAPDADTGDGLFDVVVIENITKGELLLNIRRLFDGSIGRHRKVRVLRTHSLEIAGPEPVAAQADGELLPPTPIRFKVIPSGVRAVVA
jgi:diacylglycerol kinase (ATP)